MDTSSSREECRIYVYGPAPDPDAPTYGEIPACGVDAIPHPEFPGLIFETMISPWESVMFHTIPQKFGDRAQYRTISAAEIDEKVRAQIMQENRRGEQPF